jgi:hypothetical protein
MSAAVLAAVAALLEKVRGEDHPSAFNIIIAALCELWF